MATRRTIPFVFLSPGYIQAKVIGGLTPPYTVEATAVQGGYTGDLVFQVDVTGVVEVWEEVPFGRKARFNTADPVSGTVLDAEFDHLAHQIMMLRCREGAPCWNVLDAESLTAFKAMPSGIANTVVLRGGASIADGLGGVFTWDPNSTRTDDGGVTTVAPDSAPATGRWLRITPQFSLP